MRRTTKQSRTPRASKLPDAPKRSKKGPPRDDAFLAFVREQPCLVDGCPHRAEAHHWGKRGKGQKCSDYETAPLCHFHHVGCWHTTGELPGKTREEWIDVFRLTAADLVARFFGLGDAF